MSNDLRLAGMSAKPEVRKAAIACALLAGFAGLSYLIFLGYLTPEMMVYFLTFQWCL